MKPVGRHATGALLAMLLAALAWPSAHAGGKKLPGGSMANAVLQKDLVEQIAMLEMIFGEGCKKFRVVDTEVVEPPATLNVDRWVERWTVDRCGTKVYYRMQLTPSKGGGTDFGVSLMEDSETQPEPALPDDEKPAEEIVPPEAAPPSVMQHS